MKNVNKFNLSSNLTGFQPYAFLIMQLKFI